MAAKTRADLVEEVARKFGNYRQDAASGGSSTTVVDSGALHEPDDYWVGHWAYILTDAGGESAAPEGEERPITDYDQGSYTLTVDPAFSAAVASEDTYEILPARRADLVAAVNAGVVAAAETWLVHTMDTTTVTIANDDYDYSLPTDLVRLLELWVRDETDEAWALVPAREWHVGGTPGAAVLYFDALGGLEAGQTVRLDYLARMSELATESSSLGLGEPAEREAVWFIVEYALYWLHDQAANRDPTGPAFRAHMTQASGKLELAETIRQKASRFQRPGTLRSQRWARHRG